MMSNIINGVGIIMRDVYDVMLFVCCTVCLKKKSPNMCIGMSILGVHTCKCLAQFVDVP